MIPFLQFQKGNTQPVAKTSNNQYDWNKTLEDLKAGKIDPKQTAVNLIQKLNPQQRKFLKMSLPMFQKFAVKSGATDDSINSFLTEIKTIL